MSDEFVVVLITGVPDVVVVVVVVVVDADVVDVDVVEVLRGALMWFELVSTSFNFWFLISSSCSYICCNRLGSPRIRPKIIAEHVFNSNNVASVGMMKF